MTSYKRNGKDVFPGGSDAVVTLSAQVIKQVMAMGLTTVRFTAWLDPQQRLLKLILIEAGTHTNVTVTVTIVSINQPANIQFPLASETYVVRGTS